MAITKPPHITEFSRIPAEYLPDEIGTVHDTPAEQPPADLFEGDEPFPMSPYRSSFEDEEKEKRLDSIAKAIITVDWKQILEKK